MAVRRIGALAGSVAVAGWLAGCSAPPPVRSAAAGEGGAVAVAAPPPPEPSAWGRALKAQGCTVPAQAVGDRLEHLQRELEPLGLEPRLQGCVDLATPPVQALLLDAWVTDGVKAVAVVRGPLADGQALDLGLGQPARRPAVAALVKVQAPALPDDQVSPDVQFNRRWWSERLGAYGLQAVPGQVRAFVPTP
jgi:D-alanyl-D-alanine dipeptidase